MNNKAHLTIEGLIKCKYKASMNLGHIRKLKQSLKDTVQLKKTGS